MLGIRPKTANLGVTGIIHLSGLLDETLNHHKLLGSGMLNPI